AIPAAAALFSLRGPLRSKKKPAAADRGLCRLCRDGGIRGVVARPVRRRPGGSAAAGGCRRPETRGPGAFSRLPAIFRSAGRLRPGRRLCLAEHFRSMGTGGERGHGCRLARAGVRPLRMRPRTGARGRKRLHLRSREHRAAGRADGRAGRTGRGAAGGHGPAVAGNRQRLLPRDLCPRPRSGPGARLRISADANLIPHAPVDPPAGRTLAAPRMTAPLPASRGPVYFCYANPAGFSGQKAATELVMQGLARRAWVCRRLPQPVLDRGGGWNGGVKYLLYVSISWIRSLRLLVAGRGRLCVNLGQTRAAFLRDAVPLLLGRAGLGRARIIISLHGSPFMRWAEGSLETRLFRFLLGQAGTVTVLGERQQARLIALGLPR